MSEGKVTQLFLIFANLANAEPWQELIQAAIQGVTQELRPDADTYDIRLSYYAAALANLQYRRMCAAQSSPEYIGKLTEARNPTPCLLAEQLVQEYRKNAADLLTDDSFFFQGVQ